MLIKHGRENNGVVLNEMNLMDCKWYEIIDITVCDELGMKYFIWRDPNNSLTEMEKNIQVNFCSFCNNFLLSYMKSKERSSSEDSIVAISDDEENTSYASSTRNNDVEPNIACNGLINYMTI